MAMGAEFKNAYNNLLHVIVKIINSVHGSEYMNIIIV